MRFRLVGPNVNDTYEFPNLTQEPDAVFMRDNKGLPMVFYREGQDSEDRLQYRQFHSVLALDFSKQHPAKC